VAIFWRGAGEKNIEVWMNESFDLRGEVAIVTGGSQGLGKEMAKALAQNGAMVVLASRNLEKLKAAAHEIIEAGGKAEAIRCDISEFADVQNLVGRVIGSFSQIDILINNAGMNVPPDPWSISRRRIGSESSIRT
jgi:NAD(P)-dependent dehydrogenase (short-subunit alcohol dehydrogenase family)